MTESLDEWWSAVSASAPESLAGLWFGLVELEHEGWSMYVVGTASFDPEDETAEWAVGPYAWEPADRYVPFPEIGQLDVALAVERAAVTVRNLQPWRTVPVGGAAVGFDEGDFTVVYLA
jgi:hypothetical protein